MRAPYGHPDYYTSLRAEFKYLGVTWKLAHPGKHSDMYVGFMGENDKFELNTWTFGPQVHQARIDILYPNSRSDFVREHGGRCRVGFEHGRTRQEAMRKMAAWVRRYQRHGPRTPREAWIDAFKWRLYRTRHDFLKHLLWEHGESWIDGHVDDWAPEAWKMRLQLHRREDKRVAQYQLLNDLLVKTDKVLKEAGIPSERSPLPTRTNREDVPRPTTEPFEVNSALFPGMVAMTVPDDAHPTWTALCYEAMKLAAARPSYILKDEDNARNLAILTPAILDLESRFPWLSEPIPEGACPMTHRRHSFGPKTWKHECIYCGMPRQESQAWNPSSSESPSSSVLVSSSEPSSPSSTHPSGSDG